MYDKYRDFYEQVLWGNSVKQYVLFLLLFIGLIVIFKIVQVIVIARLEAISKKTETDVDDAMIRIVNSIRPGFYVFLAVYFSLKALYLNNFLKSATDILIIVWGTHQVIISLHILVDYLFEEYAERNGGDGTGQALSIIERMVKGVLWILGALFVLQNLGINVTSLMAGLGIGGVAVAFAVKGILDDLFSSFAILFDKPFEPGDFIVVGDYAGTVESIGIKTTRIRALQGEQVVISNLELTNAKIQNFKKLKERRVEFSFGVTYDTSPKKLSLINKVVKNVIEGIDKTRFDRVNFHEFGDSALIFEVVYFADTPEYNEYMDLHEEILMKINKEFLDNQIELAYPTQTVFVKK